MSDDFFYRCEREYPRAVDYVRKYVPLNWPPKKEEDAPFSVSMSSKELEAEVTELLKKVETSLDEEEKVEEEETEKEEVDPQMLHAMAVLSAARALLEKEKEEIVDVESLPEESCSQIDDEKEVDETPSVDVSDEKEEISVPETVEVTVVETVEETPSETVEETPAVEPVVETPANNDETPANNDETPANNETPIMETIAETPSTTSETPSTTSETPANSTETPATTEWHVTESTSAGNNDWGHASVDVHIPAVLHSRTQFWNKWNLPSNRFPRNFTCSWNRCNRRFMKEWKRRTVDCVPRYKSSETPSK